MAVMAVMAVLAPRWPLSLHGTGGRRGDVSDAVSSSQTSNLHRMSRGSAAKPEPFLSLIAPRYQGHGLTSMTCNEDRQERNNFGCVMEGRIMHLENGSQGLRAFPKGLADRKVQNPP
jgi:hypothetical protein